MLTDSTEPRYIPPSYERLRGVIGTHECIAWREAIFNQHKPIMGTLVKHYEAQAKTHDYVAANQWLREAHQQLRLGGDTLLWLHSDIEAITDYCQAKVRSWGRQIGQLKAQGQSIAAIVNTLRPRVEYLGITFPPLKEEPTTPQLNGALNRITDEAWLRRQLRCKQARAMEAFLRNLGVVSKYKGIYVSDFSFRRRTEQKQRGQRLLESLVAENELGQSYTLKELADLSTSNPINRRHELMTRIRGFEEFADQAEEDWQAVLFTVTCPSKYHAVMAKSGQLNPSFNQSTPTEANAYLNTLWQRTRAAWDQANIRVFGFRVAEPHHDGTPHWHLLLWIRPDDLTQAEALFKHHALAEDGNERGAQEQRFDALRIDSSKGSAAGYIAKYIAKNIDGFGIDADLYGKDAITSALRIEAWASLWGIRQFQQIGGPSVTVWRELRRLDSQHLKEDLLKRLTEAADNGDWQLYTALMGGAVLPRKERPVHPYYLVDQVLNKYADVVQRIKGLFFGPLIITTRVHEWVVKTIQETVAENQAIASVATANTFAPVVPVNDPFSSVAAPADFDWALASNDASPWTCVNNCNAQGRANTVGAGMRRNGKRSNPPPQRVNNASAGAIPIDAYG